MKRMLWCMLWALAGLAPAASAADEPKWIIKPEVFQTLVNPNCSHCRDEAKRRAGELREDDRVLCWIRGYSDGGAIPFRFFLNTYRVISDSYGVFVYDREAGYARGFAPSYHFRFHGWRNGVMVMKDRDGTLYSCLSGTAFDGPRKGSRLQPIPTLVSDWGYWLEHYPHAVAYHMFEKYQPKELSAELSEDALRSRGPSDARLPQDQEVLGVADGNQARAYPLDVLAKTGFVQDRLNGQPCVVLWHGPTRSAAAYVPQAKPPRKYSAPRPNQDGVSPPDTRPEPAARPLTLTRDDRDAAAPFIDQETGSRWDIAGRGVQGELKGWTLTWLDSTQVKWYAWAAEYPQTTIYTGGNRPTPEAGTKTDSNKRTPSRPGQSR
jgi:hypothetical protein